MTRRPRVLLLNPPGRRRYLRDVYCSHSSKGTYLYHPMDLLAQSAMLDPHADLAVVDAIAEDLAPSAARARIDRFAPDVIAFLSGAVSHDEDLAFLEPIRRSRDVTLVGMGDVFLWDAESFLARFEWIDAALKDFVSPALAETLASGTRPRGLVGLDPFDRSAPKEFHFGAPRYDLFPLDSYRMPFGRPERFASMLTSFGCPYRCSYCNTAGMRYRLRALDGVRDELDALARMGVRKAYVRDPTFALNKAYTHALLDELIARGTPLTWNCFTRADLVDAELLAKMKRAGCYLVMYGVETASDELQAASHKGITAEQIRHGVRLTREAGIRTLGTFVLGLPGETDATASATIRFARELALDYASFNVATPRVGSSLRDELALGSVLDTGTAGLDGSNQRPAIRGTPLAPEAVWRYRRRAIFAFYLRPRYVLRELVALVRDGGLWIGLKNGLAMFRSTVQ